MNAAAPHACHTNVDHARATIHHFRQFGVVRGRAEGPSDSIGLGLFIAKAIVSAHGGYIQVSSSTDAGTTVSIVLPKVS